MYSYSKKSIEIQSYNNVPCICTVQDIPCHINAVIIILYTTDLFWHTVPISLEKASYSYVLSISSYTVHNGTVYLSV